MKVGLYFDLRNPHGWRQDPARLHAFTLEAIEEAEHLGAETIWVSEHHLFADDYLAAPLTFLAAAAARTRRIRLGTAIVVAPLHHPAEIAEQAALVDLVSNGRLDLGLGAGYRLPEYELFDADPNRKYAQTDHAAREIRRLLSPGGVTPQPVQSPLPIWMGYQGPQGARRAGLLGERLLTADARSWEPYRAGLLEGGHDPAHARMAGTVSAWVTDEPDRDWPLVRPYIAHQIDTYRSHGAEGTGRTPKPIDPDRLRDAAPGVLRYYWCDAPGPLAARIHAYVGDAPVEQVFFFASVAGMPEEMVMRHIRTICTELAPALAAS